MMAVAGSLLWSWIKPYLLWLALGLAVAATVAGVLLRTKRAGVLQERAETAIVVAKSVQRQDKAAAAAPHTPSEVSDALRKGRF